MFDRHTSILYVVMERGEMDLAVFFRSSKTRPDVLQQLINPCWMQMLYAVQALHEQGILSERQHCPVFKCQFRCLFIWLSFTR